MASAGIARLRRGPDHIPVRPQEGCYPGAGSDPVGYRSETSQALS